MSNTATQIKKITTENNPLQSTFDFSKPYTDNIAKCFYVKEAATGNSISSPEAVYEEMKEISNADQESLWIIAVNAKNRIIAKDLVGLGGINFASVDLKILFRRLVLHNALNFFMVHNHPSGDTEPSKNDISLTDRVKTASEILDIKLLDHLIIGDNGYFSFSNKGLL